MSDKLPTIEELSVANAEALATRSGNELPLEEMRRLAGLYYIFTPDEKGPEWIYKNSPYPFAKYVSYDQLRNWYISDKWKEARDRFFEQVHRDVRVQMQKTHVENRVKELTDLETAFQAHLEWVLPLRNEDGTWRRYGPEDAELAGLPMLPVRPRSLSEAIQAAQATYTLFRLSRGDATARQEHVIEGGGSQDPVLRNITISKDQAKLIADQLMRVKQPELYAEEPLDIEVEHGYGKGQTE